MATPLGVKQVVKVALPAKQPSKNQRVNSTGTSMADRNRVEPKTRVTSRTRPPLEVAKPNKSSNAMKSGKVAKVGYTADREEIPFTFIGYPKNRFKGKVQPNVPL